LGHFFHEKSVWIGGNHNFQGEKLPKTKLLSQLKKNSPKE
jgi:hypothetical protein